MIDTCRIGGPRLPARIYSARVDRVGSDREPNTMFSSLSHGERYLACFSAARNVSALVCGAHHVYPCAHADERWMARLPRMSTDLLLRGRPGSCPTLSRYTIIFLVVCALVSLRENVTARPPFPPPPARPPFCLLIGVAAVHFVLLLSVSLALLELGAVGVPSSSAICLPIPCARVSLRSIGRRL